ncbi:DCC-interacting protein 13-alpha-like, partial [Rhinatrema bivittatum]|uniref:DCC-interacting protein 13-alpha-like n=1 Tax=Rhinatrema bivittatum TaxID=194408 RepID=UPI001128D9A4
MPGIDKLPIEETLEDSPQTRSLLGVFEEDAAAISSYISQLYRAMQRIYDAQNELSAATHLTSKLLKEYEKQRFPLGSDDEVMSSTLQQFAKVIDELSSCHAVLSTQLADAMMFPISQFKELGFKRYCAEIEILTLKEVFQISSNDHDVAINRYSRLSKRRENEKVKLEVTEDVYTSRKKQHQTTMHYFCALNTLQYKKKIAILEPLLGYMQAQISFFKMGSENLTSQLEEFLANIGTSVQNVRREMDSEVETMQQTIQDLEVASDPLYLPDPDPKKLPVNRNLTRKAGYLNMRNKTGLVSSTWERQYYFTQGGNLMSQARGDVAGGLVMDIDNCSVMAVDCEDRRYCFQITSFDGKKAVILQAESRKDSEEWICTINNISKRIYLSENAEEIAARVNQSALEAVTPSPSFQQRHESMRPA